MRTPSVVRKRRPQAAQRRLARELLAKSGFSVAHPVKFTVQTTRGYLPKDYETVQAIVGMWRNVGIDANIEVYEIAKHFELRMTHKLAAAAFPRVVPRK